MTLAERFWGAGKSGPRIGQWREVVCVFTRLTNDGSVRKKKETRYESIFGARDNNIDDGL